MDATQVPISVLISTACFTLDAAAPGSELESYSEKELADLEQDIKTGENALRSLRLKIKVHPVALEPRIDPFP